MEARRHFPWISCSDTPPYYYPGYALIAGNDDLQLRRMNEEHGIITSKKGRHRIEGRRQGGAYSDSRCTAINMQNSVYLYDGETLRQEKWWQREDAGMRTLIKNGLVYDGKR